MRTHQHTLPALAALLMFAAPAAAQRAASQAANPHSAINRVDRLNWVDAPLPFPSGGRMAVVSGDPVARGQYTVQYEFPDGYVIPPHVHPTDEAIVVKSGVFLFGMGDVITPKAMKALKPGEHATLPGTSHHFAKAQGRTVIEVTSTGPFGMKLVSPKKS